jgi:hypothetical protein
MTKLRADSEAFVFLLGLVYKRDLFTGLRASGSEDSSSF